MTMAFIALLMIVGISASATRASRSALAHEADSANIKQQAAADSQKINEGSLVDEVIWVVGKEIHCLKTRPKNSATLCAA